MTNCNYWDAFKGQFHALRAIEVTLVNNHSIAIIGHKHTGKTMLTLLLNQLRREVMKGMGTTSISDHISVTELHYCDCGYALHASKECRCTPLEVQNNKFTYNNHDAAIKIVLQTVEAHYLLDNRPKESIEVVAERIKTARSLTYDRLIIPEDSKRLITTAYEKLSLSPKNFNDIIAVSTSIARLSVNDCEHLDELVISPAHVAESIQYVCSTI